MKRLHLTRMMMTGSLVLGLMLISSQAMADDTSQLKEQVQELQNRVDQLESQLSNQQPVAAPMPVYGQWEDPFAQMMLMQQQMERNMQGLDTGVFSPRMDIRQTDKDYIITMDLPGMDKDKINIETKQGMLIISGERRSETENNKNNQYYRQERSFGSFMQAIPLPEDARKDRIQANYKNGVLTVTMARRSKGERNENEKIQVQ